MGLLHLSITAADPEGVARFLGQVTGGRAMPFPPFPGCWIAFTAQDDGSAVEVYPTTHVLTPGPERIACEVGAPDARPSFVHAAIAAAMPRDQILAAAEAQGWITRICNRGPFECVEVWLENRILVELLDAQMQQDYANGMTAANWAAMFGLPE